MRLGEHEIELKGINLSVILTLPSSDAAGQTSSTDTIEQGIKPKLINVSGTVLMDESEKLTAIIALAESKDDDGKRTKYDIIEPVAEAMNIRQVRFFDRLSVKENESTRNWKVDFVLREVNSVAEAKEKAASDSTAQTVGSSGLVDISSAQAAAQESIDAAGVTVSDWEQMLKKGDELLGQAAETISAFVSGDDESTI
jgi:hypothetical protein